MGRSAGLRRRQSPTPDGGALLSAFSGPAYQVLRGNRCVLARSLDSPRAWDGMRIPRVALRPSESEAEAERALSCAPAQRVEACAWRWP